MALTRRYEARVVLLILLLYVLVLFCFSHPSRQGKGWLSLLSRGGGRWRDPDYGMQNASNLRRARPLCCQVVDQESMALIGDLEEQAPIDLRVGAAIASLWEGECWRMIASPPPSTCCFILSTQTSDRITVVMVRTEFGRCSPLLPVPLGLNARRGDLLCIEREFPNLGEVFFWRRVRRYFARGVFDEFCF